LARIDVSVEMYYEMVALAAKYNMSVAEVQTTLIRDGLERLGFSCDHQKKVRISRHGRAYCKRCWRFMEEDLSKPSYVQRGYVPTKTFLELMNKDKEVIDPLGGLEPDRRGGE
jgi:hypothetical protein